MGLSSQNLITLNGPIIFGLLILMTFQILHDPADPLEEKGKKLQDITDELTLELESNKQVLKKACPEYANLENISSILENSGESETNSRCIDMAFRNSILLEKIDVQDTRFSQYVKVIEKFDSSSISVLIASMNIIQDFLIVPFIFSVVLELNNIFKNSKDAHASKIGFGFCFGGLIFLGIIITISAAILSYQEYLWRLLI
jgi:uncharacterized protein YjgD (DUF1641 family)